MTIKLLKSKLLKSIKVCNCDLQSLLYLSQFCIEAVVSSPSIIAEILCLKLQGYDQTVAHYHGFNTHDGRNSSALSERPWSEHLV